MIIKNEEAAIGMLNAEGHIRDLRADLADMKTITFIEGNKTRSQVIGMMIDRIDKIRTELFEARCALEEMEDGHGVQ